MHPPEEMSAVIGGLRYSVKASTLIASDAYWDGHNWERRGRNCFLYRTKNGRYFAVRLTQWQDEQDTLEPLEKDEAITLWESLCEHYEIDFEDAFPGVQVEDA